MIVHLIEVKWQKVRDYYEFSYGIRFKSRPSDKEITQLYSDMKKLGEALSKFYEANPDLERNYKQAKYRQSLKTTSTV